MAATKWELQLRSNERNRRRERRIEIQRPKRRVKKPPWDEVDPSLITDTNSDLSTFKPSPAELERRHELHKPKPLSERIHLQRYQDLLLQEENLVNRKTMFKDNIEKKKALIKEIFTNQEMELSNVLAETDRTMASVKDLFGDDPLKFKAMPHITDAPHSQMKLNGSLLAIDVQTPSRLTALSDSVMRHPALNDVTDSDHSYDSDGHQSGQNYDDQQASCYQSNFDFDYYKNLLQREQAKEVVTNSCRERSDPCGIQDSKLVRKVKDDAASVEIRNDGSRVAKNESGTKSSARTSKNSERSENCVLLDNHGFIFPKERPGQSGFDSADQFNKLKKEMQVLVDRQEDEDPSSIDFLQNTSQFIKKLWVHIEAERESRENLIQEFQEQRTLIDALTGDLIYSQEEHENLRLEVERLKAETRQEILQLKHGLLQITGSETTPSRG